MVIFLALLIPGLLCLHLCGASKEPLDRWGLATDVRSQIMGSSSVAHKLPGALLMSQMCSPKRVISRKVWIFILNIVLGHFEIHSLCSQRAAQRLRDLWSLGHGPLIIASKAKARIRGIKTSAAHALD